MYTDRDLEEAERILKENNQTNILHILENRDNKINYIKKQKNIQKY